MHSIGNRESAQAAALPTAPAPTKTISPSEPVSGTSGVLVDSSDALNKYVDCRKLQKAQNATINRELAAPKRMFGLGYRSTPRKVNQVLAFPHLKENPPRKGFVEQKQYKHLCNACSQFWLRSMIALSYNFGFRVAELLDMRARQADLLNGLVVLDPGTTKNNDGRAVRLTSETYELVKQSMLSKAPDDFLFTRKDGKPIRDFRVTWENLTKKAGLPGLLFHDLRRSAVRNMVRRGVPEVVAMRISGHKTRSVFDRYNIVSESDLAEAAERIEQGEILESGHTMGIDRQSEGEESQTSEESHLRKQ